MRRQTRLADPLIDLRLFRARAFSASLIVYTVAILVVFGTFLFVFQYLQLVAGLSPFEAGLWSLPSFAAFVLGSLVSPALVRRIRPGFVMVIGAAPPARAGAASAISETGSELGGALSIAILGTLGTAVYRSQVDDGIPAGVPPEQADATRDTLGAAEAAGDDLPDPLATELLDVAREAFTQGLQVAAFTSAVITAAAAVLAAMLLRHVRTASGTERPRDAEPEGVRVPAVAAELE